MADNLLEQLATRTNGDVYIGVVGPVRVGKSTFVKKVMETLVLPNMQHEEDRKRALDEMPQSSAGPTIMTAEPKFVPANSAQIALGDQGVAFQIRLADCVGYIIDGAKGYEDEAGPKYVQTPWQTEPIPFEEAAKIGTDKVIRDHANIGVVVTTDGTINGMKREAVAVAEQEIIEQLQAIGKPFVVLLNSTIPAHEKTIQLRNDLLAQYGVPVHAVSIEQLTRKDILYVLKEALYEFPVTAIEVEKPDWLDVLVPTHPIVVGLEEAMTTMKGAVTKIRDVEQATQHVMQWPYVESCSLQEVDAGRGLAVVRVQLEEEAFKEACSEWLTEPIESKRDWLVFLKEAAQAKQEQAHFHEAIIEAKKSGYGVTLPTMEEFTPNEPELIEQNQFYGVRMLASAASYHIIRIDMEAEFSPLIGSQFHSQQLLKDLRHAYEFDRDALWQTQLFGTPLHAVLTESIRYKTEAIPKGAKERMRRTIERMVNTGEKGFVTVIL